MGRTSFALFVIVAVFLVSQKLIQPQEVESLDSSKTLSPPATPANVPLSGGALAEATIAKMTVTPQKTGSSGVDSPSKDPTITPTRTLMPPLSAAAPVSTPIPIAATADTMSRICMQQGCVTWTRPFSVTHTMNRWQVWQQFVGTGMMESGQFIYEVELVNPRLVADRSMFKVGQTYLLPVCLAVETH